MEEFFYQDGIVIESLGHEAYTKYSSRIECPYCHSTLRVFKTAWRPLKVCDDKGYFLNDSAFLNVGTQCPICGEYFNPSGQKFDGSVLGVLR